jgi:hypothetical protein
VLAVDPLGQVDVRASRLAIGRSVRVGDGWGVFRGYRPDGRPVVELSPGRLTAVARGVELRLGSDYKEARPPDLNPSHLGA